MLAVRGIQSCPQHRGSQGLARTVVDVATGCPDFLRTQLLAGSHTLTETFPVTLCQEVVL